MARSLLVVGVALVVLAGLFFSLRPAPHAAQPRERTFELPVHKEGEDVPEFRADEGDRVTLRVGSDDPLEIHLHGYDVEREVGPGGPVSISFRADLSGRFEIEDHRSGRELAVLRVDPR